VGGWLLQRTAFDPGRTSDAAKTVLSDSAIRAQVVNLIADRAAPEISSATGVPITSAAVSTQINGLLSNPTTSAAMAKQMATILHDAHARLIGEQKTPVIITPEQVRDIVRTDAVLTMAPIELPVPEVGALSVARHVLVWLVPIAAIAALVFGIVGLTAHPDRSALMRSLGFGLLLLAVLITVLGYLVPRYAVEALNKSPWARVPGRLAADNLPLILGIDLVLAGGGVALLASSGLIRRRRRWSSPVNTYRYNEERHWS
jgi:hypothetical protein